MSAKYRYDLDNAFSVSEVFNHFEETWKLLKKYIQDESQVPTLIQKLQEQDQGEEILIINLTRNMPSEGFSITQQLRNGVPSWSLGQRLRGLYTESIVQSILDEINKYEDIGQIFQVNIQNNRNHVSVLPLTYNVFGLKQRAE